MMVMLFTAAAPLTSLISTSAKATGAAASASILGNDLCGYLSVTTGGGPAASGNVVTITYSTNFNGPSGATGYPVLLLTPANANAAALSGTSSVFVDDLQSAANKSVIVAGSSPLIGSTTYAWYYIVAGTII